MLNLLRNELEQIAKMIRIKNYNNMSKEELLIALLKSSQSLAELQKSKLNNVEIEETRKIFNKLEKRFSKEKIKETREKFYGKEKIYKYFKELERKNIFKNEEKKAKKYKKKQEKKYQEEQEKKQRLKELEKKNTLKRTKKFFKNLRKHLNAIKKHGDRDNDDQDYKGLRSIDNLFNKIDEDCCKPVKTKSAFNDNYIECEIRGDKGKDLSPKEYLDMIRPCLRDMINNHKTPIRLKNPSDKIIDGEWKIQLTMRVDFISSLDAGEIRTMDTKSKNKEILMGNETDDIINELFESFKETYPEGLEEKMKESEFGFVYKVS